MSPNQLAVDYILVVKTESTTEDAKVIDEILLKQNTLEEKAEEIEEYVKRKGLVDQYRAYLQENIRVDKDQLNRMFFEPISKNRII